ncbi:MAG: hypothetical protein HQM12_14950 [SAR324 cluster bacterium]|nr:hypothetical protein [SAR324 cluster bacterium]
MFSYLVCVKLDNNHENLVDFLEKRWKVRIISQLEDCLNFEMYQKVILITDAINHTLISKVQQFHSFLELILLSEQTIDALLPWFESGICKHLVALRNDPRIMCWELNAVIHNLLHDLPLIHHFDLPVENPVNENICYSDDRFQIIDEITDIVPKEQSRYPKMIRGIRSALEELISNAFYDAPVDQEGQHLYFLQDRVHPVRLSPEMPVSIQYGLNENVLWVSVKDCYGSLNPVKLFEILKCYYTNRGVSLRQGDGGAGFGLLIIYQSVSGLTIRVNPGKYTELTTCFILNETTRNRKYKSLSIF